MYDEKLEIKQKKFNLIFHGVKEGEDNKLITKEITNTGLSLDLKRHVEEIYRIWHLANDKVRPL